MTLSEEQLNEFIVINKNELVSVFFDLESTSVKNFTFISEGIDDLTGETGIDEVTRSMIISHTTRADEIGNNTIMMAVVIDDAMRDIMMQHNTDDLIAIVGKAVMRHNTSKLNLSMNSMKVLRLSIREKHPIVEQEIYHKYALSNIRYSDN